MLKKICGVFSGIIIVALAIIAGLLIIPRIMGGQNMAVISGSMEPGIPVGSVVFVKEFNPEALKVGDVITYKMSSSNVTHRVTKIDLENQQLTTKGDANDTEDANPVAFGNVVGKMWFHVPYLGYFSIYIKTPLGIGVACGVIIILLLLNFLPEIFKKEDKK